MKKWFLILFFGQIIISCSEDEKDKKDLKVLFDSTFYDTSVINKLYLYDSIKNIVIRNIDTLLKCQPPIIYYIHDKGKITKTEEKSNEYYFDKNATKYTPKFIFLKIDSLFRLIGEKNIENLNLYPDSSIEFSLKFYFNEKVIADIRHDLLWKSRYGQNNNKLLLIKDSIISRWDYRIVVSPHVGF